MFDKSIPPLCSTSEAIRAHACPEWVVVAGDVYSGIRQTNENECTTLRDALSKVSRPARHCLLLIQLFQICAIARELR
jgi:hypothetical protein